MTEFLMPSLGADMEKGTIVRWRVKPGDVVHRGDIILEIETEKAEMEVEVFTDGVVERLLVREGEQAVVGQPLAEMRGLAAKDSHPGAVERTRASGQGIGELAAGRTEERGQEASPAEVQQAASVEVIHVTPTARVLAQRLGIGLEGLAGTGVGGAITRSDVARAAAEREAPAPSPAAAPEAEAPEGTRSARVRASPYARVVAGDLGIDIVTVEGSGPGGEISAADVRRAAASASRPPPPVARTGEARVAAPDDGGVAPEVRRRVARQRAIGALMERSKREIPHYYLAATVDLTAALAWLQAENARRPITERTLPAALLLRAAIKAVETVPEVNGRFLGGEFRPSSSVDLGVAVALRDGSLLTPAIRSAEMMSLTELMTALRELVNRARSGGLRASEMASGTLTVTNLGEAGVDLVQGVIYPPQVAIVGIGRPGERPWADRGMVGVRTVVTITLAGDHRVSNGHRGAVYLNTIAKLLQEPAKL